ncbi:MAG TPA: FtsX-like permease family protein, partial [Draconibacterium sp.]|nr:FtsX-like permease family protein [Draconibacterium sp.]
MRDIAKKPVIYFINFTGLVLSMTVVIILSVYYIDETNADRFNKKIDDIYVIYDKNPIIPKQIFMPGILKEAIDDKIPEIEKVVRVRDHWGGTTLQVDENQPVSSILIFADSTFTDIFSYSCIAGDFKKALKTPMSVVLTKKEALKLFGTISPIGETVKFNNNQFLTVLAVIREPALKSSLKFDAIVPMISASQISPTSVLGDEYTNWRRLAFTTFILMKSTANPNEVQKKISALFPKDSKVSKITLLPYSSFYFSDVQTSWKTYLKTGNKNTPMILVIVAVIILLMGVINYLNLSFSMAVERLKNTGILKIVGAKRGHIFKNIIFESVLFFFVSVLLACSIAWGTIPTLTQKVGIEMHPEIILNPAFFLMMLILVLVISTILVVIPAIKLSSINLVDSLKRNLSSRGKSHITRRVLVIAQFTIATILIAFTLAVQKQVKYGFKELGYNKENIYTIQLTPQLQQDILKEKLEEIPGVNEVAYTNFLPGEEMLENWPNMTMINSDEKREDIRSFIIRCDNNLPHLLGLKLIKGRLFSKDLSTDKDKILVNREFVKEYGLLEPLGVKLPNFGTGDGEIIGVVEDFHFQSIQKPIAPVIIRIDDYARHCYVKIASPDFNSLHNSVTQIKDAVNKLSSGYHVNFGFMDASVADMYKSEIQFRKIFFLFSTIAIFICCLGIFGLSIFASQQRIKEIGIRKINGAKVSEILTMLNKDFIKWVAISFVIATPIAYYAMHKWLENFAYKTELSWWIFALAGLLALGIALLTVSWQSWKAATRNPVE